MATATYQFNAGTNNGSFDEASGYATTNIWDGNDATTGSDNNNGHYFTVTGNTCDGTDLGTISAVTIAVLRCDNNSAIKFKVQPYFGGSSAGDEHTETVDAPKLGSPEWSTEHDITTDTNAPGTWAWSDIQALDARLTTVRPSTGKWYPYAVRITVTYTEQSVVSGAGASDSVSSITGIGNRIRSAIGVVAIVTTLAASGTVIPYSPVITGEGSISSYSSFVGHVTHNTWDIGADEYVAAGEVVEGAGVIAATSGVDGSPTRIQLGAGSVDSVSTIEASCNITKVFSGPVDGVSAVSGLGVATRACSGTIDCAATFDAAGTVTTTVYGAGAIDSLSSLDATGSRTRPAAGVISALSDVSGYGTRVQPGAGTIDSTSSISGTGGLLVAGYGEIDSASTIGGVAQVIRGGVGTIDGVSNVWGKCYELSAFMGRINMESSFSAAASVLKVFRGTISSTTSLTGYSGVYTVANKSMYVKIGNEWIEISPSQSVSTDADGGTF
jgi:hypothetical protein